MVAVILRCSGGDGFASARIHETDLAQATVAWFILMGDTQLTGAYLECHYLGMGWVAVRCYLAVVSTVTPGPIP